MANTVRDLQVQRQHEHLKDILHHLDTAELRTPDINGDIDYSSDGPTDTGQDISVRCKPVSTF